MTDFTEKIATFAKDMGLDSVITDPAANGEYAVDNVLPKAVVFPKNTKQASEVVKYANQENLAVIPRGSGSKMKIGNPPQKVDLIICTSKMNHMIDVDTANLTMTAEAGVKFRDIQARLATVEDRCYLPLDDLVTEAGEVICSDRSNNGCFLPIDPLYASSSTIGGIIATNSTGPRKLLYRLPRDAILGVRLVAPDGEILGSGGKTVKNVSGFDISKLAVGSMGSLGVLCEMTFKLLPLPEKMETLLLSFESLSNASAFSDRIFETTLLPAAVEVMNSKAFGFLNMNEGFAISEEGYVVAVALEGFEQAVDRMESEILGLAKESAARASACLNEDKHRLFWLNLSEPTINMIDAYSGLIRAKLNYPISKWKDILKVAENIFSKSDLEYAFEVQTGSGICMITLLPKKDDSISSGRSVEALKTLLNTCLEANGNLVIQEAPTEIKRKLKVWGEPGSDFLIMERLKKQIDPNGIMSPGRFVGGL